MPHPSPMEIAFSALTVIALFIGIIGGLAQIFDFVNQGKITLLFIAAYASGAILLVIYVMLCAPSAHRKVVALALILLLVGVGGVLFRAPSVSSDTVSRTPPENMLTTQPKARPTLPKVANPPPNEVPANPNSASRDTLRAEKSLGVGQSLISQNGLYRLVLQQDGNVVEYNSRDEIIWISNMLGKEASMLLNQLDGNIVVKDAAGNTLCAFGTNGTNGTNGSKGAHLVMRNDGHLVVYVPGHDPIWDSLGEEKGQCV